MKIEKGNGLLSKLNSSSERNELFRAKAQSLQKNLENFKNLKGKTGIETAAKGFESMFLYQMLQEMRKTIPESGLFGKNLAQDIFTSMMDEKVADRISEGGEFGLGKMLKKYLSKEYGITENDIKDLNNTNPKVNKNISEIPKRPIAKPAGKISLNGKVNNFSDIINKAAVKFDLDPDLIKAVIAKESSGDPQAISKTGAKGLMQLMDGTAGELGVENSFDPEQNIMGGALYLKKQLVANKGDLKLALAAYNAGPSAVKLYNGVPPYEETRHYVSKVLDYQKQFRSGAPF